MAKEKILAVDDDPGLLTLMKARLEAARYDVTVAAGGEEAVACASENIFSAAILDFKMDDMDGIALMERLLKIQPYLPVIILTAYGTIERAVDATKKGRLRLFDQTLRGQRSFAPHRKSPRSRPVKSRKSTGCATW